ncbi:hypothetical protein MUP79_07505 [Candidatus Bathyarchaeota archaeon]|nr:hypothetical protein [Candidatus Bathyarchaeota archaeon]
MSKVDEVWALAVVFGNTRRKKRKENLVNIGRAFEVLVEVYNSQKAVTEKVGLSVEMIRQFLTVLKLPKEVQKLFRTREIDSVDTAKELYALRDTRKQICAARRVAGLVSKDVRDVQRIVKSGALSSAEATKAILAAKGKGLHVFMVDLDDEAYERLIREAMALQKKPAELARKIVIDWLAKETGGRVER